MEKGASQHTVLAYENDLKGALTFFMGCGLAAWSDLSPELVAKYQATLGPPLAVATAQRRMSSLRSFLKFLKVNHAGYDGDLPSTGGYKKPKRLPKALAIEVLENLLAVPDLSKPTGLRDRARLELIYGAGLRVSEAVELTMDCYDRENKALRVTGKRGKTRWIPLPKATAEWLERYLEAARYQLIRKPTGLIFVADRGKSLKRQAVYLKLARYSQIAGIPDHIGPHTLRHTYAVHLLKGGADLRSVQELLGHESIVTTQVYTQLDTEELRRKYGIAHPRK
jgi:integrase/recombinase XerD